MDFVLLAFGFWILGFWISVFFEFWVCSFWSCIFDFVWSCILYFGFWILYCFFVFCNFDFGFWNSDFGSCIYVLYFGFWFVWILGVWFWILYFEFPGSVCWMLYLNYCFFFDCCSVLWFLIFECVFFGFRFFVSSDFQFQICLITDFWFCTFGFGIL